MVMHTVEFRRNTKERFWGFKTNEETTQNIMWALQKIRDLAILTSERDVEIRIKQRGF